MRRSKGFYFIPILLLVVVGNFACARKKMNDRDTQRERVRNVAEAKRQELSLVSGVYRGFLKQDVSSQDVTLVLEVKNLPDAATGEVDPVLIPILTGSLNLTFGDAGVGEFYSYSVQKADYDAKRGKIDLIVSNERLKDMLVSLVIEDEGLSGSWNAPDLSAAGEIELQKASSYNLGPLAPEVRGAYAGVLTWQEKGLYQLASLSLSTAQDKLGSFSISGNIKLFAESADATESWLFALDQIEFNPITKQISIRGSSSDIYFIGSLVAGEIEGTWFSKNIGKIGSAIFQKAGVPSIPPGLTGIQPLKGTYQGQLLNVSEQTKLPERLMLGIVTTPDLNSPRGIKLSGNVRFYLGPFNSPEYQEASCESLQFDFYTRQLVCKLAAEWGITIHGEVGSTSIKGEILHDSLNKIGVYEVEKQVE